MAFPIDIADDEKKSIGSSVTIGLVDGKTKDGRIKGFSPQVSDLALETPNAPEFGGTLQLLVPTERIAFVGFHAQGGAGASKRAAMGRKRLRIHVAGGKKFLVEVDLAAASNPLGFYCKPAEPDSPYRDIFFYAHGVNAKETDEPLGAMLVQSGVIQERDIQRGLANQKAARPTIGQILVEQKQVDSEAIEEAAVLQQRKKLRLGEILVQAGLVTQEVLERALAEQKQRGGKRIGEILVEMGLIREQDLSSALAAKFHLPFVDLDEYPINVSAADQVGKELIEKYHVLPVDIDARTLTIAVHDPLATEPIDALRFQFKRRIAEVVATRSQVLKFVGKALAREAGWGEEEGSSVHAILRELALEEAEVAEPVETDEEVNTSDSAVIKLVNQIIIDAYRRGASDIHVEPNGAENRVIVRFRIDGDCVSYQELPPSLRNPLVARLKIMAKLDIAERRKPQDGKIRFKVRDQAIELRVATIPTVNQNEDIVLRILAASKPLPLDRMGMTERNLRELRFAAEKPYGLVLCVGPTGSGKTTTLHSLLGHINTVDRKIWTAEDPVEITQAGLRQVQMQPKIGLTFATAMRAFLRADPDVIMVGEMRDQETASTAIEASLTGHLVVSTLHTNTAPETITRLIDMGLDPFSFSDALLVVLAQRLARSLCKNCREQYAGSEEEYQQIAGAYDAETRVKKVGPYGSAFKLWRGRGCEACEQTGYKGRLGLHELLVTTDAIKAAMQRRATAEEIRKQALEGGMSTLLQDGIQKAMAGLTDMKQVLAVCSR
jgi:type II secretory ATPase GspE/PulE/Tfp pilus assembly ATPase PilB-like protein